MIEVALFTGVGLLGYILATKYNEESKTTQHGREGFEDAVSPPKSAITHNDSVAYSQEKGHNNMVPFFGAKVTQNMRTGATNSILDTFAGTGNEYFQKREVAAFYDVVPGQGLPFGNQNESDFFQSRMVAGTNMKNVFPIEQTRVAPGVNDGYNNLGSGGYQQFNATQEFAKPRTTDELRTANKPKLSYDSPVIPGSHFITQPGLQAPVLKNRPDTFQVLTDKDTGELMYLNTTTGAQVAPASFPEQMFKEQQRESTNIEYFGTGGASFTFANYIREFTEPFEQFMKLTVGEWAGPGGGAGAANEGSYLVDQYLVAYTNPGREASAMTNYTPGGYTAIHSGESAVGAVKVNKDEDMLINTREAVDPTNVVSLPSSTQQQGVYRFNEPLPQDQEIKNMDPSILDAFRSNPYTQSLTSVA
uniref:Uncharacterized protein n=1 Tax=viral metagenome TaxID=1070528 RepID=A0A6C0AIT8_9ZZZZ